MMNASVFAELLRHVNFRDLGGQRTQAGREVRHGVLFRSAALAELSSAGIAALRDLKIGTIFDFRADDERALHPTPWREIGCRQYLVRDHALPGGRNLDALLDDERLTEDMHRGLMLRVFGLLPYEQADTFGRLFRSVAAGDGALLFHCTSGKDRTGIAAALLLSALGVPRDSIAAEYLRTEDFDILASPAFRRDPPLPPKRLAALRPLYAPDRAFIEEMFRVIEARDGSVENFLRNRLALSENELAAFRDRLLV